MICDQPLRGGAASALPLSREGSEMDPPYTIAGQPLPQAGDEPTALTTFVTPGRLVSFSVSANVPARRATMVDPLVAIRDAFLTRPDRIPAPRGQESGGKTPPRLTKG